MAAEINGYDPGTVAHLYLTRLAISSSSSLLTSHQYQLRPYQQSSSSISLPLHHPQLHHHHLIPLKIIINHQNSYSDGGMNLPTLSTMVGMLDSDRVKVAIISNNMTSIIINNIIINISIITSLSSTSLSLTLFTP